MTNIYARTVEVGNTPTELVVNENQGRIVTVKVKPRTFNINIGDSEVSPENGWSLNGPETLTLGRSTGLWAVSTDGQPGQVSVLVS